IALYRVSDQFLVAALTVGVRAVEKIDADLTRGAGCRLPHLCRARRRTASSSRSKDRPRNPRARRACSAASFWLLNREMDHPFSKGGTQPGHPSLIWQKTSLICGFNSLIRPN